jgi:membrane-associated protease RseP (regulator of RpoE activity)
VIAEFASIFLWAHWARFHGLAGRGSLPWYLVFVMAVLAATLLHETGHALLAWGLKRELLSFNAGPLQWRKREGRWKFKFDAEGFYNVGTAVRLAPSDAEQPLTRDFWVIAAGPLANLFCGSLALWVVLHGDWPLYQMTWRLLAFTASFCFIAAATNLLPFMTEDGGYSDGARILQLVTRSPLNDAHRIPNRRPILVPPLIQAPEM